MRVCEQQVSGIVELYFYDELEAVARASMERHLSGCAECRQMLVDLSMIRAALSSRPRVDAPQSGDWSAFMSRLDAAIQTDGRELGNSGPRELGQSDVLAFQPSGLSNSRRPEPPNSRPGPPNSRTLHYASYFATAALLTLVTSGIFYVGQQASRPVAPVSPPMAAGHSEPAPPSEPGAASGFAALSEQHFERSKLVVLGLANKDARAVSEDDWAYERGLATHLLDDTRLYRMAAEERGMTTLAGVMGDLELVLLQTSLADAPDAQTLGRIQRLIQKRDLVTKMDVAATGS